MKKVAKFEKVSFDQFEKDFISAFGMSDNIKTVYDKIALPKRATRLSAGYDFYSPVAFSLGPNESILIPTGIRCQIEDNYVLQIFPRSGLGFKFRMQLNNTVGIIDADYYNSDNQGHIAVKITNASNENKTIQIAQGMAFVQGIFLEYGITVDDEATGVRNGGFGSTS